MGLLQLMLAERHLQFSRRLRPPGPGGFCRFGCIPGFGGIACLFYAAATLFLALASAHGEPDLLSFAAITDEPPTEVAAADHDRCIVPLKPENVAAWLSPAGASVDAMYALREDRYRPFYEHRLAA